jgi:hypothetical protein
MDLSPYVKRAIYNASVGKYKQGYDIKKIAAYICAELKKSCGVELSREECNIYVWKSVYDNVMKNGDDDAY